MNIYLRRRTRSRVEFAHKMGAKRRRRDTGTTNGEGNASRNIKFTSVHAIHT